MRYKIKLESSKDICNFVQITCKLKSRITLTDPINNYRTNGKSLLGVLPTIEWDSIYCECEEDIFIYIRQFIDLT